MRQMSRLGHRARLAVRRRPRPRWLRPVQLVAALLLLVVAAGFGWRHLVATGAVERATQSTGQQLLALTEGAGLVLRQVYSEGRERTDEHELRRLIEPYYGHGILALDTEGLRQRIESLPWVASASVARRLPDQLWIRIEEHRPLAVWDDGKKKRLIDEQGRVVAIDDLRPYWRLPELVGAGAPAEAGKLFRLLAAEPGLMRRVTDASLIGNRRWNVYLDHRIEVRLPEERVAEAWSFLAREQERTALLARAITAIDLRQSNWLVLRLADEALPPSSSSKGQGA